MSSGSKKVAVSGTAAGTSALTSVSGALPISGVISIAAPRADSAVVSIRVPLKDVADVIASAVGAGRSAVIALNGSGKRVISALTSLTSAEGSISARISFTPGKPST